MLTWTDGSEFTLEQEVGQAVNPRIPGSESARNPEGRAEYRELALF